MASPEQDYSRFRDHGDVQALAAVFDALAPELLLVAAHLTRDGAAAEDLVQTTFVDAIVALARGDWLGPFLPIEVLPAQSPTLARSSRPSRRGDRWFARR